MQIALRALEVAGLEFPVVAKPDRGHHGYGVRPVECAADLLNYIEAFPRGETIVLQKIVALQHEAGVFYVRLPGERSGRIFSMNLSAPAQVVGDGASSLRQLILAAPLVARCRALQLEAQRERLHWIPPARETIVLAFARSLRLGATLTDARQLVTPANPRTQAQTGTRSMMKWISREWSELTAAEKATWLTAIAKAGESAFNAFVRIGVRLWANGLFAQSQYPTVVEAAPAVPTLPTAVVTLGLCVSATGAIWLQSIIDSQAQAEFGRYAERVANEISRRFRQPIYGLNGGRGLYACVRARCGVRQAGRCTCDDRACR